MTKEEFIKHYEYCLEMFEFWSDYTPDCFKEKHGFDADLAKCSAVLDELRRDLDGNDEPRTMRELDDDDILRIVDEHSYAGEEVGIHILSFARAVLKAAKGA